MRRQWLWTLLLTGCAQSTPLDEVAAGRYAVREIEVDSPSTLANGIVSGLLEFQAGPREGDLLWALDLKDGEIGFGDETAADGYAVAPADTHGATFASEPFDVTLGVWSDEHEWMALRIPLRDAVLSGSVSDGEARLDLVGLVPLDESRAELWRDYDVSMCAIVTGDDGGEGAGDDCMQDRSTWDVLPEETTSDGREAFRLEAELAAVRQE